MTEQSKWIWRSADAQPDDYADFRIRLERQSGTYTLRISSDSDYAVYCNGELAAFGQYGDYPDYKIFDEVAFDACLQEGENEILITAWHYGVETQTHIAKPAGIRFEMLRNGVVMLVSDETVESRQNGCYRSGLCTCITTQLGLSFAYDANGAGGAFSNAVVVDGLAESLFPRPVKKLELLDRVPAKVVMQGGFVDMGGELPSQSMQNAALTVRNRRSTRLDRQPGEDGIYAILDMGEETVGFLDLDLEVPEACEIEIGWGEHLDDGRCRTGVRQFGCVYRAKPGRNTYLNPFRRLGCRYIQLFVRSDSAQIHYAGIRPTVYPVEVLPFDAGDPLRNRIYEVGISTLRHCMHEHYEDCPWREQALYTMDSRNQMLCGYYAFGELAFPRANLELISHGVMEHGLLNLCYPAGFGFPIPAFSLVFFRQMKEYLLHSGDRAFAEEKYPMMTRLMQVFLDKPRTNGLIETFYGEGKHFWNFYEWSQGMSGQFDAMEPAIEAPLNAFLSLALQDLAEIADRIGMPADAAFYRGEAAVVNQALRSVFYDPEYRLFHSFLDRDWDEFSVLTNSLCLLCGAADGLDQNRILQILAANGASDTGLVVVPNTLSMNGFRFDALLQTDEAAYSPVILQEIDRDYGYMLSRGATTFWETINGADDFDGAGSLCHGWSALPVYYYHRLLKQ